MSFPMLSLKEFRRFRPQKPTCALFHWPPDSYQITPDVHRALWEVSRQDAACISVAVPPARLPEAFALAKKKIHGIHCAAPHQAAILPLLEETDDDVRALHLADTVAFQGGRAIGYNTELAGFAASLQHDGIALHRKKVLLLGCDGAAKAMACHCAKEKAHLTITGPNLHHVAALQKQICQIVPGARVSVFSRRHIPCDMQIVLHPGPEDFLLSCLPRRTEYLFDAACTSPVTKLMQLAGSRKTRTRNGLLMQVMQAAQMQTLWFQTCPTPAQCETALRRLSGQMAVKRLRENHGKQNIVLCGFTGSGKTTLGRKLARLTGLKFYDSDQYLEEQEGQTIAALFSSLGEHGFRDRETACIHRLAQKTGIVLSLGGGAVLRPENVRAVKQNGLLICLDTPYYRIVQNLSGSGKRPRPLLDGGTDRQSEIYRLYHARKAVYRSVSDCSVRGVKISELLEHLMNTI